MKDVRIIKRYQNRKLYDTYQSCYVTLEEISQIIREGNEIQVIDNKTKNDITYMTQIQLLFDQERKSVKSGDTELLKRVIRAEEGTLTGYIRKLEADKLGVYPNLSNEAERSESHPTMGNDEYRTFAQNPETNSSVSMEATSTLN